MELKAPKAQAEIGVFSKMIVFISCGLAIALLFVTVIILHIFRSFSQDHLTIQKHLCICLILIQVAYMGGADRTDILCSIVAGSLHFLMQAVFVWLFLSAFQLYLLLVEPTYNSRMWCYSIVAYGMPAIIVCISAFIDSKSYGTPEYCFLRYDNYYIFSFVGPAASCIMGAFIVLTLIICRICFFSSMQNKESMKINTIRIRSRESWFAVLITVSCWTFWLMYIDGKVSVFGYIFASLNCLQGLSIFVFYGLNDSEVQQAYRKWKGRSCSQPKGARSHFPLSNASISNNVETPYLPPSTTVSSLSTVTTPEMEFPMGTFHHSDLCHTTRSPIYDNREQLAS